MSEPTQNGRIDYIEFGATDIDATKRFYQTLFGWTFTDYGPDYTSFHDGRLSGGFSRGDAVGASPLVVIYAASLEATYDAVVAQGGTITREIFSFPGGRRFHFRDPSGNELAIWSE
jgi:predicted enzyme related to lactoylglutathione lyase